MSTKSSLFFQNQGENYIHFFEDCAGSETFYLEKTETNEVKYKFNLEELCLIAKSVDLSELERLSHIADEIIMEHVIKTVAYRMDNNNNLWSMFALLVYGPDIDPVEKQIENGFKYYVNKRNRLKQIWDSVSAKKINKIDYGMPV
jgi:hypothetical protein